MKIKIHTELNYKDGSKEIEFQDLSNETCSLKIDRCGNLWFGRRSNKRANLSLSMLDDLKEIVLKNTGDKK